MDEKKINTNKVAETVNGYNSGIGDKSDSNPPSVEVINEDNSDITCGYCGWKPEWLQIFNTPRFLLACVSWFTFTQGKCNYVGQLINIYKHFNIQHYPCVGNGTCNHIYIYRSRNSISHCICKAV